MEVVRREGFEPSTIRLKVECSTTELPAHLFACLYPETGDHFQETGGANALWRWMHHDKKNHHAEVRDMAWRGIGRVEWPLSWEKQIFEATWEQFLRLKFSGA